MEAKQRRRIVAMAILAAALVVVLVYRGRGQTAVSQPATSPAAPARGAQAAQRQAAQGAEVVDVGLEKLSAERPHPVDDKRNPFRFQPKASPPPSGPQAARTGSTPGSEASAPAGPPAPPPIALKFIGIVEAPGQAGKLAVLSDGRNVFHGKEGDIIEGRYRIVRIGAESIEIAHVDGRGRQVIRLSGS